MASAQARTVQDTYLNLLVVILVTFIAVPYIVPRVLSLFAAPITNLYRVITLLMQQLLWLVIVRWHLVRNLNVSLGDFGSFNAAIKRFPRLIRATGSLFVWSLLGSLFAVVVATLVLGMDKTSLLLRRENAILMGLFRDETPFISFLLFLSSTAIGPLVEELLCRGYFHGMLKAKLGERAVWISSLLFTLPHLYIIRSLPIYILGVKLTREYERHGNLWDSIIVHGLYNGVMAGLYILGR
ncbi:MAG: CPBP family intramembrane glutamic endopeptidase [Limnochordia bacterium]